MHLTLDLSSKIDLHIFMIVLMAFISLHMKHSKGQVKNLSYTLFQFVILSMLFNTVLDLIGWITIFNGEMGLVSRLFNFNLNSLIYATLSLPISFWLIYVDYKIYEDEKALRRRFVFYFTPTILQVLLVLYNINSGFIFSIDPSGTYVRGSGFYIVVLSMYLLPAIALIMMIKNRKTISTKLIEVILLFWSLPVLSAFLQLMYYGLMITWPVFDLVTIFTYILVEKESLLKDPLTLLNSRRVFEERANDLIKRRVPFSILMVDLDDFKLINDKHGHEEGDKALKLAATILREAVHGGDFICRYGGDEFVLLVMSDDASEGFVIREKIYETLNSMNEISNKVYALKMSIGVKFYENTSGQSLREKLETVDQLMYAEKMTRKKSE